MSQTAEVVVVGGGAIGSSVAYYLSREGTKVLVLEKEAVGSGATAHATGSLSLMGTEFYPGPHFQLALESYRMYTELVPRLEEETGIEINYQRKPALRLALDEDEEWLIQEQVAWKKDFVSLKTIDGDEARRLEPRLNPRVRSGVYQEECARVDSYRLNLALVQAAESHGAQVQLRQVTGLETQNSRVTGVRTTDGTISCGTVVLAMGAWSAECGRWLNFPVPVRPLKGEKLLLKYDGAPLPFFLGSPRRGHMLTLPDGLLSVGSTGGRDYDPQELYVGVEYDRRTTEEAKMQLLHRAIDLIPEVEGAQLVQQLAGSRPLSADRMPIIGPIPRLDGVLVATGHATKGIHLAPVTGRAIADYVLRGAPEFPLDMDTFLPARFAGHEAHDFRITR